MWQDLDHEMAEAFIQNVFKSLFGDQYEYYSYDDALKKIQSLKKTPDDTKKNNDQSRSN